MDTDLLNHSRKSSTDLLTTKKGVTEGEKGVTEGTYSVATHHRFTKHNLYIGQRLSTDCWDSYHRRHCHWSKKGQASRWQTGSSMALDSKCPPGCISQLSQLYSLFRVYPRTSYVVSCLSKYANDILKQMPMGHNLESRVLKNGMSYRWLLTDAWFVCTLSNEGVALQWDSVGDPVYGLSQFSLSQNNQWRALLVHRNFWQSVKFFISQISRLLWKFCKLLQKLEQFQGPVNIFQENSKKSPESSGQGWLLEKTLGPPEFSRKKFKKRWNFPSSGIFLQPEYSDYCQMGKSILSGTTKWCTC